MNIAVVGTGYVGLVTGTCFAEMGNDVICVDIDEEKVARMQAGDIPIYEPGLSDLFKRNVSEGRLTFTTDLKKGVIGSTAVFLALPTPESEDGSANLSYIFGVADDLGKLIEGYTVVVEKSTVPVGTAERVRNHIAKNAAVEFDVVSNPEFLREGQAVNDFMKPERIVIGTTSFKAEKVMRRLYEDFVHKDPNSLIVMDAASAEMTKYAANAFLATKISFINAVAGLCEATGANVEMVRRGIGTDSRIGDQFLYPGPGYGGSCFPKDTQALLRTAADYDMPFGILKAVEETNDQQKKVIPEKVLSFYGGAVADRTFALWGLAFKDNTDDIRESPALEMIRILTNAGARVVAFDPQAIDNVKKFMPNNSKLKFADDEYAVLKDADALLIATNWKEFSNPNFEKVKELLKKPIIFDGRNLYSLDLMQELGFHYESIGRKVISSDE